MRRAPRLLDSSTPYSLRPAVVLVVLAARIAVSLLLGCWRFEPADLGR